MEKKNKREVDVIKLIMTDIVDSFNQVIHNMNIMESIDSLQLEAGLISEEEHDRMYVRREELTDRICELRDMFKDY